MKFSILFFSSKDSAFSEGKYHLFTEAAKFADANNFDAVWIPERHFNEFGGIYPNPAVLASALAMITTKVRLRAGSVVLPLHHPVRVAEEWAVVDNLSGGRVDIGFAVGWNPDDFILAPEAYNSRVSIFYKNLELFKRLWQGDTVDYLNGKGSLFATKLYPLPKQSKLDVWITCSGGTERFVEAGHLGANILTALLFQDVDELSAKIKSYRKAREEKGFNPEDGVVTLMMHTFIGADIKETKEIVRSPFTAYIEASTQLWKRNFKGDIDGLSDREKKEVCAYAFERYYETSGLFGTQMSCIEKVERLKAAGVNEIASLIDFGIDDNIVLKALPALGGLKAGLDKKTGREKQIPQTTPSLTREEKTILLKKLLLEKMNGGTKKYPLTIGQQGLLFLHKTYPEATAYNTCFTAIIANEMNGSALEKSFHCLLKRHPSLSALYYIDEKGEFVQEVPEHPVFDWQIDPKEYTDERSLRTAIDSAYCIPFDLKNGKVMRVRLFRKPDSGWILMLCIHHIASDGWSMTILLDELLIIYNDIVNGIPPDLPSTASYFSYIAHQQKILASKQEISRLEAYWRKAHDNHSARLSLPGDLKQGSSKSIVGKSVKMLLAREYYDAVKKLANTEGITMNTVFLAAYQLLLHFWTGQKVITTGTPMSCRNNEEFARTVGYFANLVPISIEFPADFTGVKLFREVYQKILGALEHQELPVQWITRLDSNEKTTSEQPLFHTVFSYIRRAGDTKLYDLMSGDYKEKKINFGALALQSFAFSSEEGQFDLTLEIVERTNDCQMTLKYNTGLFTKELINTLMDCYQHLLCQLAISTPLQISQLRTVTPHRQNLLQQPERRKYSVTSTIHQMFERQALLHPEAIALTYEQTQLTYRQLNEKSNALASTLIEKGVMPEQLIAIVMPPSIESVISILAVLKSGAAYLPLEPDTPVDRLRYIIEDAKVKIVLIDPAHLNHWNNELLEVVAVDHQSLPSVAECNFSITSNPRNLAYVIYTSGSTGKPKGVQVEHAQVVRLFAATDELFDFTNTNVWTLFHSCSFDFSVWEIFGALFSGGSLVIIPYYVRRSFSELYRLLKESKVSVLSQTPSVFRQVMAIDSESNYKLTDLRYIIFGGEALDITMLAPWFEKYTDNEPHLINMYGITETTVHVTFKEIRREHLQGINNLIGKPLPDLNIFILNEAGNLLPAGFAGEMFVGGDGITRGYLNNPALTAEKFINHPFLPNEKLYKTGDYGRWLQNGELQYCGRVDDQVKIRGYRIELNEISHCIRQFPEVAEVIVRVIYKPACGNSIIAWIIPNKGALTAETLKIFLREKIPAYMIPEDFVFIDECPITENGKIDYAALPLPDNQPFGGNQYSPPANDTEEILAGIFGELLERENIGSNNNFFELGGNSLMVYKALDRIEKRTGVRVTVEDFFLQPDIRQLSDSIRSKKSPDPLENDSIQRVDRNQIAGRRQSKNKK